MVCARCVYGDPQPNDMAERGKGAKGVRRRHRGGIAAGATRRRGHCLERRLMSQAQRAALFTLQRQCVCSEQRAGAWRAKGGGCREQLRGAETGCCTFDPQLQTAGDGQTCMQLRLHERATGYVCTWGQSAAQVLREPTAPWLRLESSAVFAGQCAPGSHMHRHQRHTPTRQPPQTATRSVHEAVLPGGKRATAMRPLVPPIAQVLGAPTHPLRDPRPPTTPAQPHWLAGTCLAAPVLAEPAHGRRRGLGGDCPYPAAHKASARCRPRSFPEQGS